ncbi:hypothetical protein QR680_001506 [Steinernema hermaphroditum]|uniref:Uncharacterized protein n=1 Tax=Steinernema hermaphroditum TaxID=289476 RepID=A0AA39LG64_9BILA|nr:hypothetical protein QR680_001506 [Steinernema hermaphroditum]
MAAISSSSANGPDNVPTTFTVNMKGHGGEKQSGSSLKRDPSSDETNDFAQFEITTDGINGDEFEEGNDATVSASLVLHPRVQENFDEEISESEANSSDDECKFFKATALKQVSV